MKKALIFAATIEAATGLALLLVPSFVARLLLGEELTTIAVPLARVTGIALIAFRLLARPAACQHVDLQHRRCAVSCLPRFCWHLHRSSTLAGGCAAPDPDNASDLGGIHKRRRYRMTLRCLLLAQSGHHDHAEPCPLSGAKQTSNHFRECTLSAVLPPLIRIFCG